MHFSAFTYVEDFYLEFRRTHKSPPYVVLEFGSMNVNGSVRNIFYEEDYWGIDLAEGHGVDEVADASTYIYNKGQVDIVVCCETLEHTPLVPEIVNMAYLNLVVGGWFVITCAREPRNPHSAIDGRQVRRGEYYKNVDPQDLKTIVSEAGFQVHNLQLKNLPNHGGDLYLTAQKS